MKAFKAGNIEVMSHDYYRRKSQEGTLHMDWGDYNYPQFDLFITKLKEEGWRVPTREEAYYLLALHEMKIGDFSDKFTPYSSYFIEPIVRDFPFLENEIRVLNFHKGNVQTYEKGSRGLLRLVRSI